MHGTERPGSIVRQFRHSKVLKLLGSKVDNTYSSSVACAHERYNGATLQVDMSCIYWVENVLNPADLHFLVITSNVRIYSSFAAIGLRTDLRPIVLNFTACSGGGLLSLALLLLLLFLSPR